MFANIKKNRKSFPASLKASFWFLICGFFQKGISVITTPIFTRILSTEEFGQFSVFSSWLSILAVFVTLNLCGGVFTRGIIKEEEKREQFTSAMQGLTFTLFVVWTVVYLIFHKSINTLLGLSTLQVLSMLILMWTSAVFGFWSTSQRVLLKYKVLVILTIIVSIIRPIVGIFLVLHTNDKVTARIMAMVLVDLIAYTWMFIVQIRNGKKFYDRSIWKYAILFNLPLIPHYLSMTVLNGADRIMIGSMISDEKAGIYNLAYSISQIMTIFNTALLQTIDPWLYKKINLNETKQIPLVAYPAFILIATVSIALIALAPEVVSIFAPETYHEAIYVIPPIAMSILFMFVYNFFAVFEFYFEKTKYIALATIVGAIINIILNYFFISKFGYFAAGYTTLICYIIFAIGHYLFMRKLCLKNKIDDVYNIKILILICVVFMSIGFFLLFTYNYTAIRYSFILIFIVLIFLFRKKILFVATNLIGLRKEQ